MLPCFCTFTIMGIVFCHFLILHQIFFPPQMKQSAIISNKHGIYELPHELPNDLRLRVLKNRKHQETIKTSLNNSLVPRNM